MIFSNTGPFEDEITTQLSQKLGREIKINGHEALGGGCIHSATRITTNAGIFFLKWNSSGPGDIFLREAECLKKLKVAAGELLVIPDVMAVGAIDDTPGFLVLEYLEPGRGGAGEEERLGRGLASIHKFAAGRFGFDHDNYCGRTPQNNEWRDSWCDFYVENRLRPLLALIHDSRQPDRDELRLYNRLLEKIPSLLPHRSTPVLIHGDLWAGNYMMTRQGPALIDPASCFADREMEFGMITLFGGFSQHFFSAYQEENPLPDGWEKRNRIYQWYHILNHYYLFGRGYREQAVQIARDFA